MRTDSIYVTNEGFGFDDALDQAEAAARFRDLGPRGTLKLRLLTEEMIGMMRFLTDKSEGDFWIEEENGVFALHLRVDTPMNADMRKKLLAASTSGENSAAKGVTGKLRDLFDRFVEPGSGKDGRTAEERWDELEKSVIANLADDVSVGIVGATVEMTVTKAF